MLVCLLVIFWRAATGTALLKKSKIVNGDIVVDPSELSFLCRMHLRGWSKSHFCGATLVAPDFAVTAKHCVNGINWDFYSLCVDVEDCYVACRDLSRVGYDVGQFRVSILDAFWKDGPSDLAVIQLKEKVHEHKDYDKGVPIVLATLATKEPEEGDEVLTAGWGQTGFREGFSEQLRKLKLKVTSVEKLWVKTGVKNEKGEVADPCDGDSGGPLLIRRQANWEVVGTLLVNTNGSTLIFYFLGVKRSESCRFLSRRVNHNYCCG